jgi:hypothetical protein
MIFWLVLKLGISYRVIISWRILVYLRGFFEDYIFAMVKYVSFHNSFFCLKIRFNVNGKASMCHTPCFYVGIIWVILAHGHVHSGRFPTRWTSSKPKLLNRKQHWLIMSLKSLLGGMDKLFPKIIIYFKLGKIEFLNEISKLRLQDWGSCM